MTRGPRSPGTLRFPFLSVAVALASIAVLYAQSPVFRSETHVVEVSVIAKDAAQLPVADLQKSDLTIFDNGVAQTILTLEKLTPPASPTAESAPSADGPPERRPPRPPARRLTAILLDGLNTETQDQLLGVNQISQMLRDVPPGNDAIALYTLGDELRVLHNFTTDYKSLRSALANYYGEHALIAKETPPPPAMSMPGRAPVMVPPTGKLEEMRQFLTNDAFREISRRLGGISGEKNLIWITAGFDPPKAPTDFYAALAQLAAAKIRVYPIDTRGLIACEPRRCPALLITIDSMIEVAAQTGGHAYHDTNALAAAARLALDDTRVGYGLTYAPNHYLPDGSLHKIEIRSIRPGVDLRYRPGYIAEAAAK